MEKFTLITKTITSRPRSKRLREVGSSVINNYGGQGVTAGIYLPRVEFDDLFEKVETEDGHWYIKAKASFVSDGGVAALDQGDYAPGGGGTGGGLDLAALEAYLKQNNYATQGWVNSRGFLLQHQAIYALTIKKNGAAVGTYTPNSEAAEIDITDVASAATLAAHTGDNAIHITAAERLKWNSAAADLSAILGSNSNKVLDKWEEIKAFLATYTEADTLANLLGNKADKTQLADYVTLSTDQTIKGAKIFNEALNIQGGVRLLYANSRGYLQLGNTVNMEGEISAWNGTTLNNLILNTVKVTATATDITAASFKKYGGTSAQFLKADGSVDTNSYALASTLGNYYTKAQADGRYVASLDVSGNYVRYIINGTAHNITVPYATNSSTVGGISPSRIPYGDNGTATTDLYTALADTIRKSGFYRANEDPRPLVIHSSHSTNTYAFQLGTTYSTDAALYIRHLVNNVWGTWATILDTKNYPSILDTRYYTESELDSQFMAYIEFSVMQNYVAARFKNSTIAQKAADTYIEWWQNTTGSQWFNFAIGKLTAHGDVTVDGAINIGSGKLSFDAASGTFRFSHSIVSEGGVAALNQGDAISGGGGSGSGGLDLAALEAYLLQHGYATQAWVQARGYLTSISKAMVESVLTGNITTHTHSQYALASALGNYYTKSEVDAKNYLAVIDAMNTVDTAKNWSAIRTDMRVRFYDVYGNGGPTLYGNVMEIAGRSSHWQPQLWFDSGKTGSLRHRNRNYDDTSWGDWITILDSNNYTSILDGRYALASALSGYLPYTALNGGLQPISDSGWGNAIGQTVACWGDGVTGASAFKFKKDNPSGNKMSMLIDGTVYINEGQESVASQPWADGRFARLASPNNLVHASNEVTMIPDGFNSNLWLNYRAGLSGSGTISSYNMGNGHGGYAGVVASSFTVSGGTASQFLMANGSLKALSDITSAYISSLSVYDKYLRYTKNGQTGDITIPYAVYSDSLFVSDTRSDNTAFTGLTRRLRVDFKNCTTVGLPYISGVSYVAVMSVKPWNDYSGGPAHQIGFNCDGELYHRMLNTDDTFGAWRKLIDSANYASILDGRYLQLSGGTMANTTLVGNLNADLLDGHHKADFNAVARLGTRESRSSGYYKIKIKSTAAWMLGFKILAYQYYTFDEINISGYNYGANHWYLPSAGLVNSQGSAPKASIDIRFGYDSAWNLWVAIPAAQYTGIAVTDVVNGYDQVSDIHSLFEVVYEATLTGTVQTTVTASRHAMLTDNVASATNADKLDGYHESSFVRSWWTSSPGFDCATFNTRSLINFTYSNNAPFTGAVIDVNTNGYGFYLGTQYGADGSLYYRRHGISSDGGMGAWQRLARITDNVASATKLADNAAYTAWGQTFFQYGKPKSISGDMTGVGNITTTAANGRAIKAVGPSAEVWLHVGNGGVNHGLYSNSVGNWIIASNGVNTFLSVGNVAIGGEFTPAYKLHVQGDIYADGWLRTSGARGWYSQTYGGGWYMTDSTYIRNYNSKRLRIDGIDDYYAIWLSSGGFCAEGYAGASWDNGYGALNAGIANNAAQTPLIVAYRNGSAAAHTGADRLFAMELLNTGGQMRMGFGGAWKFIYHNSGTFENAGNITSHGDIVADGKATVAELHIGGGTITWDATTQTFRFSHSEVSDGGVAALKQD